MASCSPKWSSIRLLPASRIGSSSGTMVFLNLGSDQGEERENIMSTEAFDDLLQRAKSELTAEEQQRLAEQLAQFAGKKVAQGIDSANGKSLYDALNARYDWLHHRWARRPEH